MAAKSWTTNRQWKLDWVNKAFKCFYDRIKIQFWGAKEKCAQHRTVYQTMHCNKYHFCLNCAS